MPQPDTAAASPKPWACFAIIIPVRNEEKNIGYLLEDLDRQTFRHFEVLVINDQSTDGTAELVKAYRSRVGYPLKLLHLDAAVKQSHKKAAIRLGIAHSESDLITTTDGDCRVGERWLEYLHGFYQEERPKLISAGVTFSPLRNAFEKVQAVEFMSLIGAGAASMQLGAPNMCNGANLTYERAVFEEVGGFEGKDHIASGDDEFLMHKIHGRYPEGGVRFLKSREAIVRTAAQPSFRAFFQQRKRWASKWNHYDNMQAVAVAIFIYALHLASVVLLLGLPFFAEAYREWALALLAAKALVEYPYLRSVLKFHGHTKILPYIWLAALLHSAYIVGIGLAGKVGKYQWKGREI